MTPRRAHKARAQGLLVAVSLSSFDLARAVQSPPPCPSEIAAARSSIFGDFKALPTPDPPQRLSSPFSSRVDPKSGEISRVWVSIVNLALKLFVSMLEWIRLLFPTTI